MFDRPQIGETAVLVQIGFTSSSAAVHKLQVDAEDIQEFSELARSAGADVVAIVSGKRAKPEPKFLFGQSKVEDIRLQVEQNSANLVLVNHILSPAQERNLERELCCRVLDRTSLILDIFAQRASSHEGRLQVELAQLKHLSTRLVRGWTHLERQKGGIGLRGPGETQLETDRRLIGNRIKQLQKRLIKVRNQRQQGRQSRKKADLSTVSLVGYTNAGKSTVFNQITGADIYTADQLFATLDPTLRRAELNGGDTIILADTVGFIRDLPHELVVAFHSTLEETKEAQLLLHIIDASNPQFEQNISQVNIVLKEIGAADIPQLQVFNKIDLLSGASPHIDYAENGLPRRVWVSALSGQGVELVLEAIERHLTANFVSVCIKIEQADARLRALVFESTEVKKESMDSEQRHLLLTVRTMRSRLNKLLKNPQITVVRDEDIDTNPLLNYCG